MIHIHDKDHCCSYLLSIFGDHRTTIRSVPFATGNPKRRTHREAQWLRNEMLRFGVAPNEAGPDTENDDSDGDLMVFNAVFHVISSKKHHGVIWWFFLFSWCFWLIFDEWWDFLMGFHGFNGMTRMDSDGMSLILRWINRLNMKIEWENSNISIVISCYIHIKPIVTIVIWVYPAWLCQT